MADAANELVEDEGMSTADPEVDAAIRAAGGEREAIRALLIRLEGTKRQVSLGYRRGRQPRPPA